MRKPRQDETGPGAGVRTLSPIPDAVLAEAAALWWRGVGPGWPRRPPPVRAAQGIVALTDADRGVLGVAGLRDGSGGFAARMPPLTGPLFRAAPPTDDLVLDGIVARHPRQGIGRALVAAALVRARDGGHPGLRAEVEARNRAACAFYLRLGFQEVGRGRYGWPWSGQVLLLRRPVAGWAAG